MSWQDTKVSMVTNAWGTTPRNVSIGEILRDIQGGKWAKPIATIREVYNEALAMEGPEEAKKAIAELKKKLPAFLTAGVFSKRASIKLDVPSGLMGIDLDNNQNTDAIRAKLASDLYVAALWASPSGSGLKVVVNIRPDASLYSRTFKAARLHFQNIASSLTKVARTRLAFASSRTTKPSLCAMATCKFWSHWRNPSPSNPPLKIAPTPN